MAKAIIYGRVSTSNQDYTRQLVELREYANKNGLEVVKEFTEKCSGTIKATERNASTEMMHFLATNETDVVLVSEVTRLGRNARDIQNTITTIVDTYGVNLFVLQYSLSAYLPNGKRNPMFNLISDVVANLAEMENSTRIERIKSGIAQAKRNGVHCGRAKGTTKDITQTRGYKQIVRNLKSGLSIRKTAKVCGVSCGTVQKVKAHLSNQGKSNTPEDISKTLVMV